MERFPGIFSPILRASSNTTDISTDLQGKENKLGNEKLLQDEIAQLKNAAAETSAANEEMQDQIDNLTKELEEKNKTQALEAQRWNSKLLESEKLLQDRTEEVAKLKNAAAETSAANEKMQDQIDKLKKEVKKKDKVTFSQQEVINQLTGEAIARR
ncbi:unnamed protein product [Closterium sp. NIES-64]|nr:unnamed protein product [Closterium sp. NIES-64]CAI6010095.1 unnamed protein product [Closterium sp. NIES-65]